PLPKLPHTDPKPIEPKDLNPQAPQPPRDPKPSPFPRPVRRERPDSRPDEGYPQPFP
ncbi:hypothetical protein SAMD00019534_084640, partial [Acytostelium subglobosum LB1]|uniref:hypothetical protein n=1 Tax=Acytostelium subglobosum LB1 TaxID=1410327 RepID=UPI000644A65F